MKIPVELKPGLWGAAAGAVAISILGFTQLGWTGPAAAERQARESANMAVVAALVPLCINKARTDPDLTVLAKFQAEQSSYSRGDIVQKAGWASLDGKTAGSDTLARACAEKLHTPKAAG